MNDVTKQFKVYFIFTSYSTDEEYVMDETQKHKQHYFPRKQYQAKRITNDEQTGNSTLDSTTYNSANPVNFLFSNELDFDDDDDT